jgi:Lar family restriction alleviation protein
MCPKAFDMTPLPCPFCGETKIHLGSVLRDGYATFQDDPDARAYYYICNSCACQGGWAKSATGALKHWNMRTEGPVVSEQLHAALDATRRALGDAAITVRSLAPHLNPPDPELAARISEWRKMCGE